jgi:CheY-like chemotaxis protein
VVSVLYVDDEPPLRKAVHAWLGQQGVDVHSARSIAEATEVLGSGRRFDGAFIDIWLSDGSGFEIYDWIARHDPRLAQRVVFITGDILPSPETQRQLDSAGRPVLSKPFDLAALDQYVAEWSRA